MMMEDLQAIMSFDRLAFDLRLSRNSGGITIGLIRFCEPCGDEDFQVRGDQVQDR